MHIFTHFRRVNVPSVFPLMNACACFSMHVCVCMELFRCLVSVRAGAVSDTMCEDDCLQVPEVAERTIAMFVD